MMFHQEFNSHKKEAINGGKRREAIKYFRCQGFMQSL
jgi:hypothetical protein